MDSLATLDVDQAARLLGVSGNTVRRWARQGLINVTRPVGEPVFERDELVTWARNNGMALHEDQLQAKVAVTPGSLAEAVTRGGIFRGVEASDRDGVLAGMVAQFAATADIDGDRLLGDLVERESLSTTGLGHGVALPHPRTPSSSYATEPRLVLGLLTHAVDWKAVDGEAVHTVFMLLSPSPAQHLQTLSRVAYLLRDTGFTELLASQPGDEAILEAFESRDPSTS